MKSQIKICGIKDPLTAFWTARLGAKYIGIILYEQSKRSVNLKTAVAIVNAVKIVGSVPVIVFVNETYSQMIEIITLLDIDHIQLHSKKAIKEAISIKKNIKKIFVISVDENGVINSSYQEIIKHMDHSKDYLLFDNTIPGSGKEIITKNINSHKISTKYFLAGGINVNNILSIIKRKTPYCVDISSGVENIHGSKDLNLIKNLILKVRS